MEFEGVIVGLLDGLLLLGVLFVGVIGVILVLFGLKLLSGSFDF